MRIGLVLLVFLVGACTQSEPPASSPAVPVFSSAPRNAGAERTVPDDCGAVATLDDLTRILGTFVPGPVHPVVGVPQDNIGRTARLDCYYSQPGAAAHVWIGLASYVNAESARKRLTATVASERNAAGTVSVSDVSVGADRGVLVRNANWLLVAGRGRTTVVVRVLSVLVPEEHAGALLGQVADFALTER
jgi:hypothetical protein